MDPSPFHERDLDDDAEEFIVGWAREFPRRDPVSLVVHVNQLPAHGDAEHLLETAVHNYFTYRVNLNRLDFTIFSKRSHQPNYWPGVSGRLYSHEPTAPSTSRNIADRASRRPDYRRLGGHVASHGNLPLRMVAAPAHGSALRKTEPDARGSAKNESTVTTPWPWF
jgi:hypothetical protein